MTEGHASADADKCAKPIKNAADGEYPDDDDYYVGDAYHADDVELIPQRKIFALIITGVAVTRQSQLLLLAKSPPPFTLSSAIAMATIIAMLIIMLFLLVSGAHHVNQCLMRRLRG